MKVISNKFQEMEQVIECLKTENELLKDTLTKFVEEMFENVRGPQQMTRKNSPLLRRKL